MIYLGFDPGGSKGFGAALYDAERASVYGATVSSVDEAMVWAIGECAEQPVAAGIDTLLFWQSTPSGWRGADEHLRRQYPACRNSVVCSNGLYGSMSVQGAVLAGRLRERWPQILLTETHPKVLWSALKIDREYPRKLGDSDALERWTQFAGLNLTVTDEHQFDAALSAWAAERGSNGIWLRDLTALRAEKQTGENISVVNDVHYFWPE